MDYDTAMCVVERLASSFDAIETRLEEIRDQLMIANGSVPSVGKPKDTPPPKAEEVESDGRRGRN